MRNFLSLFLSVFLICSFGILNTSAKRYNFQIHNVSATKVDSSPIVETIVLTNNDSTNVMAVHWQILNDGFQFSGWTYSFCDLSQCYVTSYPPSATDPLVPKTDGAFSMTVSHFNNKAITATMTIKVWDPNDPNNPDTISMTINAERLGINENIMAPASFDIYPNPVSGMINFKAKGSGFVPKQAAIYDIQGKIVSLKDISEGSSSLPVYGLPSGFYFLNLTDKYGREARKQFIKE